MLGCPSLMGQLEWGREEGGRPPYPKAESALCPTPRSAGQSLREERWADSERLCLGTTGSGRGLWTELPLLCLHSVVPPCLRQLSVKGPPPALPCCHRNLPGLKAPEPSPAAPSFQPGN